MYSTRAGVRVLSGGLCACASASVIYNKLTAQEEQPTIQKFTGGEPNISQSNLNTNHLQLFNLPNMLPVLTPTTSPVLTPTTSPVLEATSKYLPAVQNCDNRDNEDSASIEVDGGVINGVLSQRRESSSHDNSLSGFGSVPGIMDSGGFWQQSEDGCPMPAQYTSKLPSGPLGPELFAFTSQAPGDVLSPEYENDSSSIDSTRDRIPESDDRIYLTENIAAGGDQNNHNNAGAKLKAAINHARDLCWQKMYESGSPGMVVSISVNGKNMWSHGFGYADLENRLLVGTGCIMRIASISKSITMAVLARLVEQGKVDLDADVRSYVPDWPEKSVDGEKVVITVRQLCSHLSGVRHYTKKGEKDVDDEFELKEYHLNKKFKQTKESLELFKDDELHHKPGSEFLYSTHGYTLLAAVIENVTGVPFEKYMQKQFRELGLSNTYLDESGPIIFNRAQYYVRDKHHRLRNAPLVDNSYKWAGGGFLSNVHDLIRFGNAMMYSYQKKDDNVKPSPPVQSNIENNNKKSTPPPDLNHKADNKTETNVQDSAKPKTNPKLQDNQIHTETKIDTKPVSNNIHSDNFNNLETNDEIHDTYENIVNDEIISPSEFVTVDNVEDSEQDPANVVVHNETGKYPENVVFQPGPMSAVNKSRPNPVRYLPGYLKSETMREMWSPAPGTDLTWGGNPMFYGLGWAIRPRKKEFGFCANENFYIAHTGGAIGASSLLYIAPQPVQENEKSALPKGVVVAILCNMQGVGLTKLAADLGQTFEGISMDKPAKVEKVYQC